jgi:hypothetical protein
MTDAAVASLATMAITVAGFGFQAWRQYVAVKVLEKQRAWDLADREEARRVLELKTVATAKMLAEKTIETGRVLARKTDDVAAMLAEKTDEARVLLTAASDQRSEHLAAQIAIVHEAAASAFDVGNHSAEKLEKVNQHLENLNQRLLEHRADEPGGGGQTAATERIAIATEDLVKIAERKP